jgi:hypothetical protein
MEDDLETDCFKTLINRQFYKNTNWDNFVKLRTEVYKAPLTIILKDIKEG